MPIQFQKKYLFFIIAGVAALVAVFLINIYIQQQVEETKKRDVLRRENLATVVVARQDIPAGAAISENMVREETLQKNSVQPRAATSIDRVVDKIALVPLAKGEQVLLNKLTIAGQETSLATKVPKGKRAIAIPVDNISSVGGMVRPGDHVDIVGIVPIQGMGAEGKPVTQMATMPLFQDILVLAVGKEFTPTSSSPRIRVGPSTAEEKTASNIITLALLPHEANLVAFVQEQGKIRLILRSPEDTQVQPVAPASWDALFRTVMPQAFQEQPAVKEEAKKKVEIYRGTQREVRNLE